VKAFAFLFFSSLYIKLFFNIFLSFVLRHQFNEMVEQWSDIMRTRTGLRMTLKTKGGFVCALYPLQ
jgi:succinate dehydrogenase hydrophobic anchor subunit